MLIVGIVGSPRKNGNTHTLVSQALGSAERLGADTRLVTLRDQGIQSCRGCEACADDHRCVIDDDMQSLYPLILEADGLVLGSPVHFYNISALMKAFIDRCYCLEAFDRDDRSCWVGIREALGWGYAVTITVGEQAEEEYSGFATEALTLPLRDLGFRVIDTVKATGSWSPGEVVDDNAGAAMAARAGERLARTIMLRASLDGNLPYAATHRPFERE